MRSRRSGFLRVLAAIGAGLIALLGPSSQPAPAQQDRTAEPLLVFAAASQKDALDAVIMAYHRASGEVVRTSYLSSSVLARQIEQGAPADLFIAANVEWMDYVDDRDLIDRSTRVDLLSNRLVVVAPRAGTMPEFDVAETDLAALLGTGRLAMGDPDHVPAGIYAAQALRTLGAWDAILPRLARTENVRVALALVARGETPLGIVYASDAVAEPDVRVVGRIPASSHDPIVYPAAVTSGSTDAERARALLAFLRSPEAGSIFRDFGFLPVD